LGSCFQQQFMHNTWARIGFALVGHSGGCWLVSHRFTFRFAGIAICLCIYRTEQVSLS
jgi:FtsH-binding integral membrane protein